LNSNTFFTEFENFLNSLGENSKKNIEKLKKSILLVVTKVSNAEDETTTIEEC
jgi:hypothetical protein